MPQNAMCHPLASRGRMRHGVNRILTQRADIGTRCSASLQVKPDAVPVASHSTTCAANGCGKKNRTCKPILVRVYVPEE